MTRSDSIIVTPVRAEMEASFLEYSMSVIVSRALPDVRDGLKPVHRRILYSMHEMGLRPNVPTRKCAQVVGKCMGSFHPHGDSAIYEALVRQAVDWYMRLPLVTGQGNFGSLAAEDPPAAMRYTECRMAPAALAMLESIDEDTVDMKPNYDGKETEPKVLPAAFPNLLVNGGEGIAVGMATKMAPHNLVEVVAGIRALMVKPDMTLEELMTYIPGPDLPTGGTIIGMDGVRDAFTTGRGSFKIRATAKITDVTARKRGIMVTELPYQVGPEKGVIAKINEARKGGKLQGVSDVKDLTDRKKGLQLLIEVKTGYNPAAVLEELYRLTDLEISFGVNNVCLVDNAPQTLGLLALCKHFINHRMEVTTRRTRFRLNKAEARAHILEGLVKALDNIDEVVRIIRGSKDSETARERLMSSFELSEIQAQAILDMTLRRLTSLEVTKLKDELAELRKVIAELSALLASEEMMRALVSEELERTSETYGTPRRTKLLNEVPDLVSAGADSLQIEDEPCTVTLTASGLIGRTNEKFKGTLGKHDVLRASLSTTTRSVLGAVTSKGRLMRLGVVELPALAGRSRGGALKEFFELDKDETIVGLSALAPSGPGMVLVTASGVIKRLAADYGNKPIIDVIALKDGDRLVAALELVSGAEDLVMVTSDAQLLRTSLEPVRAQGRSAGGVAGMKVAAGQRILAAGLLPTPGSQADEVVVTITDGGAVKVSDANEFPAKGRGGSGVRCHKFLKDESVLVAAHVGASRPGALSSAGEFAALPEEKGKRDGAGVPVEALAAGTAAVGWSRR